MKTEQKQDERVIYEDDSKQISLTYENERVRVIKRFYDHSNRQIYVKLMQNPHPNISEIFRVENIDDGFLVEEAYLGDKTLSDIAPIKDVKEGYDILFELCSALKHLHGLKIVHRDLKLENVFYTHGRVILNDFDISKPIVEKNNARQDTQILGSVGYASPEQYGFSISDERTDIYSLGIIINLLFSGSFINEYVLEGNLGRIVERCTKINADDRYQTIEDLEKDLEFSKLNKSPYTLPGFRSNKLSHKIAASFGYFIMIAFIVTVEAVDGKTFYDHFKSQVLSAILVILTFVIATNYLDIKSLLPRKLRNIKFVGAIILWSALFFSMMLVYVIIFGILDSMLTAYLIL